jgi:hypothetical protein
MEGPKRAHLLARARVPFLRRICLVICISHGCAVYRASMLSGAGARLASKESSARGLDPLVVRSFGRQCDGRLFKTKRRR